MWFFGGGGVHTCPWVYDGGDAPKDFRAEGMCMKNAARKSS